jgi:hypothetical protein
MSRMNRRSIGAAAICACSFLACTVDVADDGGFGSGVTAPVASTTQSEGSSGHPTGPTSDEPETSDGDSGMQSGEAPTSTSGEGDDETTTSGLGTADAETSDTTSDGPGDPLHPDLEVPSAGQVCQTPGSLGECPAVQVCRFHTTEQGLCESCDVCGNLDAPCQSGTDCDILFACFAGRCTNICPLGTQYCGPVEACLDVGHPTHGVCDPF